MAKYEVGDLFKMAAGANREIKGVTTNPHTGVANYWVWYTDLSSFTTVPEGYIESNWTKVEPFYEVGKSYIWKVGSTPVIYKVVGVYSREDRKYAMAERYLKDTFTTVDLLVQVDFSGMTEA